MNDGTGPITNHQIEVYATAICRRLGLDPYAMVYCDWNETKRRTDVAEDPIPSPPPQPPTVMVQAFPKTAYYPGQMSVEFVEVPRADAPYLQSNTVNVPRWKSFIRRAEFELAAHHAYRDFLLLA